MATTITRKTIPAPGANRWQEVLEGQAYGVALAQHMAYFDQWNYGKPLDDETMHRSIISSVRGGAVYQQFAMLVSHSLGEPTDVLGRERVDEAVTAYLRAAHQLITEPRTGGHVLNCCKHK